MLAFTPGSRRRSAALPRQLRHTSLPQAFYGPDGRKVNRILRPAGPSRTRLPQVAANLVLWLGWLLGPVAAPYVLFLFLEGTEV
jgi:hypothetical protein